MKCGIREMLKVKSCQFGISLFHANENKSLLELGISWCHAKQEIGFRTIQEERSNGFGNKLYVMGEGQDSMGKGKLESWVYTDAFYKAMRCGEIRKYGRKHEFSQKEPIKY